MINLSLTLNELDFIDGEGNILSSITGLARDQCRIKVFIKYFPSLSSRLFVSFIIIGPRFVFHNPQFLYTVFEDNIQYFI